jgi:hydroxymethylpyrimidine/phosphomethylpyrimidine kinase
VVADLESARAAGVHAASVISVLTNQDSCGVRALWPQPAEHVAEQCRAILADSRVGGIKVGLLGGSSVVRVLGQLADEHPGLPMVLDPVLASGTGQPMADAALLNQLRNNLLGRATLVTPNLPEARTLGCASEPDDCARRLLASGCRWTLITGAHAPEQEVVNRLYGHDGSYREWSWPRLPHEYHGSGCTLASAIAARLAKGVDMIEAIDQAQAFTWRSLQTACRTGRCQLTPNRLHALDTAEEQDSR